MPKKKQPGKQPKSTTKSSAASRQAKAKKAPARRSRSEPPVEDHQKILSLDLRRNRQPGSRGSTRTKKTPPPNQPRSAPNAKQSSNKPQLRIKKRQRGIVLLLTDEELLGKVQDLVETGAAISTVEAAIGLPTGRLREWLQKGKELPRTPYRIFYNRFRKWAAEAKATAEAQQLSKAPSQWLERNTSAKLIEAADNQELIPVEAPKPEDNTLKLGATLAVNALKVLAEQGINLNEALLKDQVNVQDKLPDKDI